MKEDLFILNDINEINRHLIALWKILSEASIREKGYFSAVLSGGNTPVSFYEALSRDRVFNPDKTYLFQADERHVGPDNADSNAGVILKAFGGKLKLNGNFFAFNTDMELRQCAADYEKRIRLFFKEKHDETMSFDLMLLGIGTDGHTASLFPGTDALNELKSLTACVISDKVKHNRITMTYGIINKARNIVFTAVGSDKADIIKRIIKDKDKSLPASQVIPLNGNLTFLMDKKAAVNLH